MDSNRGDPYEVSPRFRSQGDEWSDLLEDMRTNHEEEWTKHTKDNGKTHNPTLDDMLA